MEGWSSGTKQQRGIVMMWDASVILEFVDLCIEDAEFRPCGCMHEHLNLSKHLPVVLIDRSRVIGNIVRMTKS